MSVMALSIKQRTREAHVRAEEAVRAFDPFATRERYAAYMGLLHSFYAEIEPRIDAWWTLGERRKLPRIARDLETLGAREARRDVRVPEVRSRASAFGVAYVLEGKTLGSRFLLAEIEERLHGIEATSFLSGYGAQTGAMWNQFRAELEDYVSTEGRRAAVLRAASETFACFTACIAASPRAGQRAAESMA